MRDFLLSTKPLKPNGPWRVDLQLRPKELQAIGHVAAQWALLEHLILEHSKFLAGEVLKTKLPENAENDSLRQRKRAWEALARRAFSSEAQELAAVLRIVQKVGSLAIERHKIVHGLFEWDDKNRNKLRLYSRANARGLPSKTDWKRMEAFAEKVAILNHEFLCLHGGLDPVPFASTRRRGKPIKSDPPPLDAESQRLLQAILEGRKNRRRSSPE